MSTAVGSRPSLYSTYVGKKYAMAISGMVLMGFVLVHMIGNLKLYFGATALDRYSHWLRTVGEPALPSRRCCTSCGSRSSWPWPCTSTRPTS